MTSIKPIFSFLMLNIFMRMINTIWIFFDVWLSRRTKSNSNWPFLTCYWVTVWCSSPFDSATIPEQSDRSNCAISVKFIRQIYQCGFISWLQPKTDIDGHQYRLLHFQTCKDESFVQLCLFHRKSMSSTLIMVVSENDPTIGRSALVCKNNPKSLYNVQKTFKSSTTDSHRRVCLLSKRYNAH